MLSHAVQITVNLRKYAEQNEDFGGLNWRVARTHQFSRKILKRIAKPQQNEF